MKLPAKSEKQRRFMGAELGRLRAGKETKTSMNEDQLGDFASKELIKSIDVYLDKQSRLKCGHKKGDPNHLEAA